MRYSKLFVCLAALCLSGCTTMQPAPQVAQNKSMDWGSRVSTLSGVQNWDLKAMIGMRNLHKSENVSATLQWQQHNQNYHIALFGPMGSNAYELTGGPGHVDLAAANGKHTHASSPEALLDQQTGWVLPVSDLYYWIRGIPVPNVPAEKNYDAYHHLTVLKQQGWTIQYMRYTSVNDIDLPSKIFLNNPDLNVKIVIGQWQI